MFTVEEIYGIKKENKIEAVDLSGILVIPENIEKIISELNKLHISVGNIENGDYFESFINGISKSRSGFYICNLKGEIFKTEATLWGDFSCGYAKAWTGNSTYGFINEKGKLAFGGFFETKGYSEGLAPVKLEQDGTYFWQYLNIDGKIVESPRFRYASKFKNGVALVQNMEEVWQIVNKNFDVINDDVKAKVVPTLQKIYDENDQIYYRNFVDISQKRNGNRLEISLFDKREGLSCLALEFINKIAQRHELCLVGWTTKDLLRSLVEQLSLKGNFLLSFESLDILPVELISGVRISDESGKSIESYAEIDKEMVRSRNKERNN